MRSNPRFNTDDWRGVFSIDFCELRPLEYLLTLDDALQDYSEELGDRVPKNASRMVVLSQRYLDVTCLDYSQTGEPKVFIADFDIYSSKQELRVDDFATFFESLKRLQS